MKKIPSLKVFLIVLISTLVFSCTSEKDAQYQRPEWLAPPIYEQLQTKGNFKNYLACVDKAGYKNTLNGAGYYTAFVPNDDAFQNFLSENGISSVNDISEQMAKEIVSYSLAVSPASFEEIDDYQNSSAIATEASKTDVAFKRKTFNYKGVYTDFDVANEIELAVIDMNAVSSEVAVEGRFDDDDYNQKNIPFFTESFMVKEGITAADYNYFYPETELTDFNVADAKVVNRDMYAENGIIHEVDKVILPLKNLEELLAETDECSEFKNILEKYLVEYDKASDNFQLKYEQYSGKSDIVFVKDYPACSFALNCENYLSYGGGTPMDTQVDGWTLFAPSNSALHEFYNDKFFKFGYNSLDEMPSFVLLELVNAHLFRTTVWPSKFAITGNPYGEEARFDAYGDVFDKAIGSNGMFYAVNKVQDTDAFNTVLGDIILNPEYSLMYKALETLDPMVSTLKNTISNYIVFLITNDQITEAGFRFNTVNNSWEFTDDPDRPDLGYYALPALNRFIYMHVVLLNADMIGNGVDITGGTGMLKTYGDEYVSYNKGVLYGPGNTTAKKPKVTLTLDSNPLNGQSYALDRGMLFSDGNIGDVLSVSSFSSKNRATTFLRYLEKIAKATYVNDEGVTTYVSNCVYDLVTKKIKDIANTDYITVFLPNDLAIKTMVSDGILKDLADFALDGDLNVLADDNVALEQFVKYHIIKGNVIAKTEINDSYVTYRKLDDGTYATLLVQGSPGGTITVTDNQERTAQVLTSTTSTYNILGNRAIVHVIDNYLTY